MHAKKLKNSILKALAASLPEKISDLYPVARSLKRKLHLVIGPTNSGKTHQALERLKTVTTGVYLGPLRLLAIEIRDRLQADGFVTSLITGEMREVYPEDSLGPGVPRLTASTIEMLNFTAIVDMAIIDEVQMLADPQRGAAWVQAILGAPAKELWLLGSPEVENAIRFLAAYLDESLEIVRTHRLAPLQLDEKATSFAKLPPQSAIIAFSRREVLDLAAEAAEKHHRQSSIIYGALSPEVRILQAQQFNSGETELIISTDAISMGLNLPVKHIYFSSASKWNGSTQMPLPKELVWQIAGRAGRYGLHETGHVGALDPVTLKYVKQCLSSTLPSVPKVYRQAPTWPIVSLISKTTGITQLALILELFLHRIELSDSKHFKSALTDEQMALAELVDRWPSLPLKTRLLLSGAPVPLYPRSVIPSEFALFVKAIAENKPFNLNELWYHLPNNASAAQERAEFAVRLFTLYCWLHYRWPALFADLDTVRHYLAELNAAIHQHLRQTTSRRCGKCGEPLRRNEPFRYCNACYYGDSSR